MKKQPTPVQGYDTQLHSPRSSTERGASEPTTKPAAKSPTAVQKTACSEALDEIPISDLKSRLVTGAATTGDDQS